MTHSASKDDNNNKLHRAFNADLLMGWLYHTYRRNSETSTANANSAAATATTITCHREYKCSCDEDDDEDDCSGDDGYSATLEV